MEKKAFVCLVLLVGAWLGGYVLLRPDSLMDTDSYLYLGVVCHKSWAFVPPNHAVLWEPLLSIIPCNLLLIKVIQASLLFFALLAVMFLGKLFFPENGWHSMLFVGLSPLLFMSFWGFEGMQFAIPLLFWSAWFIFKGKLSKNILYQLFGLALVVLAGLLWKGAILWLLGLALFSLPALLLFGVIALSLGANFAPALVSALTPNLSVAESVPLVAFAYLFFLWIGLLGLYRFPRSAFKWFAVFLLVIGVLVSKYLWMTIPFLAICILPALSYIKEEKRVMVYLFVFLSLGFFFQLMLFQTPTQAEWQGIRDGITLSKGLPINNFWGWTYWIQWEGGNSAILRANWGANTKTKWVGLVISPEPYYSGKPPPKGCKEVKRFVWRCSTT